MTTRTHLSIGEVLSLLTDDFPDLTITKIRFLESQGLISPERTASGYRKFYDSDIERLRWILRQQRENFLPLKVIRERLNRSEGKPVDDAPATGQTELDLARDPGRADPPPVWMADHAAAHQGLAETSSVPAESSRPAAEDPKPPTEPTPPAAPPRADPASKDAKTPPPSKMSGHRQESAMTHDKPADDAKSAKQASKPSSKATSKAQAKPNPKPQAKPKSKPSPPTSDPARTQPAQASRTEAKSPMPTPKSPQDHQPTPTSNPGGDLSDVSLTREELLGSAGLDDRQLTQLESFGIVVAAAESDTPLYGAEALVCARQAGVFLELGMEPRHLRAFKVAADREAGLYEQLVLPLLRQRNPAARAEAGQLVGRLTSAGAAIHAALLQQSLRSQLRPRR